MKELKNIWYSSNEGEEKIIVLHDNIIYKSRAKGIEYDEIKYELSQGRIDKRLIGMPLIYVKTVEFRDSVDHLKFNYNKDSIDTYTIKDNRRRKEVFDAIQMERNGKYSVKTPNFFLRTKHPLIALGVVLIAFFFVYMFIELKKEGTEFESAGIFAFLIYFAEFGLEKHIMGFSFVSLFLSWRIWLVHLKNNEEVHTIKYR